MVQIMVIWQQIPEPGDCVLRSCDNFTLEDEFREPRGNKERRIEPMNQPNETCNGWKNESSKDALKRSCLYVVAKRESSHNHENAEEQKVSELDCSDYGMAFGKQKANGSANRGGQKQCVNVIGKILIGQWTVYFGGVTIHSAPFNILIGIVDISRLVDSYLMKILSPNG